VTLTSSGAASTATVAGSPYPIVPSAATGGTFAPANYTIYYVNGSLTVLRWGAADHQLRSSERRSEHRRHHRDHRGRVSRMEPG
jgi:hypothetical protein